MSEVFYTFIETDEHWKVARALCPHVRDSKGEKYYLAWNGEIMVPAADTWFNYEGTELPFDDFIQRFFPLEIVAIAANMHGYGLVSKLEMERNGMGPYEVPFPTPDGHPYNAGIPSDLQPPKNFGPFARAAHDHIVKNSETDQ